MHSMCQIAYFANKRLEALVCTPSYVPSIGISGFGGLALNWDAVCPMPMQVELRQILKVPPAPPPTLPISVLDTLSKSMGHLSGMNAGPRPYRDRLGLGAKPVGSERQGRTHAFCLGALAGADQTTVPVSCPYPRRLSDPVDSFWYKYT